MKLKTFIRQLETSIDGVDDPSKAVITLHFPALNISDHFASYRGDYSELCIVAYADEESEYEVDANELLAAAKKCIGAEFEGYKGGQFTMDKNTTVWVSRYGRVDGLEITGFRNCGKNDILLKVEWVDDD